MAVKKTNKKVTRSVKKTESGDYAHPVDVMASQSFMSPNEMTPVVHNKRKPWMLLVPAVLLLVAFLLYLNRSMFLVATINGAPVYRWDFNAMMESRYGKQTLEGLVSERLIAQEAQKSGIAIAQNEIDAKVQDVMKSVGTDVSLDELLAFQGMTKDDFTNQIKLQLTVEKLLGKDVTITENDINNFIATNRAVLKATADAELKEEARKMILDRTISGKLQNWFTQLRSSAVVETFIK